MTQAIENHIWFAIICLAVCLALIGVCWLYSRLTAAKCPNCGSVWKTECYEFDDRIEFWLCTGCGHDWKEKIG